MLKVFFNYLGQNENMQEFKIVIRMFSTLINSCLEKFWTNDLKQEKTITFSSKLTINIQKNSNSKIFAKFLHSKNFCKKHNNIAFTSLSRTDTKISCRIGFRIGISNGRRDGNLRPIALEEMWWRHIYVLQHDSASQIGWSEDIVRQYEVQ